MTGADGDEVADSIATDTDRTLTHARMLLEADTGTAGLTWPSARIAEAAAQDDGGGAAPRIDVDHAIRPLVKRHFPAAARIMLSLDTRNTGDPSSLDLAVP